MEIAKQKLFRDLKDIEDGIDLVANSAIVSTDSSKPRRLSVKSLTGLSRDMCKMSTTLQQTARQAAATASATASAAASKELQLLKQRKIAAEREFSNLRDATFQTAETTTSGAKELLQGAISRAQSTAKTATEVVNSNAKSGLEAVGGALESFKEGGIGIFKPGVDIIEGDDIVAYTEGEDNAAVYRTHEHMRDVHDHFLTKQAGKDVRTLLQSKCAKRLPTKLQDDIRLRAGVLPAPTGEQQQLLELVKQKQTFSGTKGQLRAARERLDLEEAFKRNRKRQQLKKMLERKSYATPAGKQALEIGIKKLDCECGWSPRVDEQK